MTKLKMLTTIQRGDLTLEKDKEYDLEEIIVDSYKVKVPRKQKGKFQYALVKDEEGKMIDNADNQ